MAIQKKWRKEVNMGIIPYYMFMVSSNQYCLHWDAKSMYIHNTLHIRSQVTFLRPETQGINLSLTFPWRRRTRSTATHYETALG